MSASSTVTRTAALLLLTFGVALLRGCTTDKDQTIPASFRVMTYNIHHGEGLDGKVDLPRIAEIIKCERADIVALQEVDRGVERMGRRDLPAELAILTSMTCVFSNNFHFQGGEYGNAVLARFPIRSWTNTHYKMLRPSEQRGLLQLTLDVHGRELFFMNTHIDYRLDDTERLQNVSELREIIRWRGLRPVIVCGDFNDTPGSRVHRTMKEVLEDTWELAGQGEGLTFSADKPAKRIDYIWISKDKSLVPLKAWVPQSDASDHLPVVGEFRFAK